MENKDTDAYFVQLKIIFNAIKDDFTFLNVN